MSHKVEDPERFGSSQFLQAQENIVKFLHAIFNWLAFFEVLLWSWIRTLFFWLFPVYILLLTSTLDSYQELLKILGSTDTINTKKSGEKWVHIRMLLSDWMQLFSEAILREKKITHLRFSKKKI